MRAIAAVLILALAPPAFAQAPSPAPGPDPRTIRDTATVQSPQSAPVGLDDVIVGGVPVLRGGKIMGQRPGKVLRRG